MREQLGTSAALFTSPPCCLRPYNLASRLQQNHCSRRLMLLSGAEECVNGVCQTGKEYGGPTYAKTRLSQVVRIGFEL